jgi:hypothetical protein
MKEFLCGLLLLSGMHLCQAQVPLPAAQEQQLASFDALHPSADSCILFHGLPRNPSKSDFTGPLFSQGGFLFYKKPIEVSEADSAKILSLVFIPENHQKNEPKFCGGFHPDYTIHRKTSTGHFKIMVCLGCHEWKLSDGITQLYSDPTKEAFEKVQKIVAPYLSSGN